MKITPNSIQNRAHGNNDSPPGQALRFLTDEISNNLLESISYISEKPSQILALGPDSEPDQRLLQAAFPGAIIDAAWPEAGGFTDPQTAYDLLFASHALLYASDLMATLNRWYGLLKPDRPIFFASLGPQTLLELQQSFFEAGSEATHTTPWMDLHDLGDLILKSGFSDPVMHSDTLVLEYSGLDRFFAELKHTEANQWLSPSRPGLMGAQLWKRMRSLYEKRFTTAEGKIPVTVEVIYGHAWKKPGQFGKLPSSGEVCIPVDQIRKK